MFLATQYYRAPFPNRRYWADDFAKIRDCGIHAVQLWCLWGWIEAEPGRYDYNDYDELVGLADKAGLKVVLSTIAEIHPFWIHRLVPDSQMVDHMGNRVISTCREEVNGGLTPGGCFDHPRVAELMGNFLAAVAGHYSNAANLLGWDAWNETRWSVQSDGHVCYCGNTLREFRAWLDQRHGGLGGLNNAWQRRYVSWDDVFPGKTSGRPYTESMEFQRFLAWRAARHTGMRYQALRAGDARHFISAHCAGPSTHSTGGGFEQALCRGNDWDHADHLDGYGCSHFPFWGEGFDETGFGVRVEAVRSANQGKVLWVSELHGGSARDGIVAHRSVDAGPQQRWVANGMARGAKAVIFWCWRDEVFGRESSGFGLNGWDGQASQRLAAMRVTSDFIDRYKDRIDSYKPDAPRVGILFAPDNYYLKYASTGSAAEAGESVIGYATALERLCRPYEIVEAGHLDVLESLDVLFMPWCLVLPPEACEAILRFLRRGGRILTEAETDSFDGLGFYRYPDERPFLKELGLHDLGRRKMAEGTTLAVRLGGRHVQLPVDTFLTPLTTPAGSEVLAGNDDYGSLLVRQPVGAGAAYLLGSFSGRAYKRQQNEAFEQLLEQVCMDAGVQRAFEIAAVEGDRAGLQWRTGAAGNARLLWIVNSLGERTVTVLDAAEQFGDARQARDLTRDQDVPIYREGGQTSCEVTLPAGGFVLLEW
jgi:beta-galactosidase